MKTKFTSKNIAVFLLLTVGYFSACTSELEVQVFENAKTETRAIGLTETSRFYYYYGNKRQYLQLNTRYMFVSMTDESIAEVFAANNITYQALSVDITEDMQSTRSQIGNRQRRFYTVLSFDEAMSEEAYWSTLSEINNLSTCLIVAPFFKSRYFDRIGLTNFFYVKLKDLNDIELLKQKAEKKYAVIVHQNEFMPLWWVLSVTDNSNYNAMEIANHFHRVGLFQYAEPDFLVEDEFLCANDEHFWQQWGLRNAIQFGGRNIDINICNAWQISTGSNVVVAVLDDGINLNHPDLRTNIYPRSFDSESGTSPQRILPGSHGTPVAGIIGAVKNNTIGIAGVAPNSKIMSISNSLAGTVLSRERRANGINWAVQNGADVINNSWRSTTHHRIIDDAINNAVRNGRNGRGSVVIFAAGNDGSAVNYPASLPNVIAVGAINRHGQRRSDSSFGSALDVMAPGDAIWTTALGGGYTTFSQTSSAAPHVSGVAALMLSVNPNLTERQVRDIIKRTANRNLPNFTVHESRPPNGSWNRELGHGLVNAYQAVRAAFGSVSIQGPTATCWCSPSVFTVSVRPPGEIPGNWVPVMPPNATITWAHSPNLQRVGGTGATATFSQIGSSGAGWVEATVNGVRSHRFNVWVGSTAGQLIIHFGMWEHYSHTYRATVSHPSNIINRFVWRTWSPGWYIIPGGTFAAMDDVRIFPNSPFAHEATLVVRPYTSCNCENWEEWDFVGRLSDPRGWRSAEEAEEYSNSEI